MNRTTLNKATSPDPNPTPGYLFDEIAKVTHDPLGNDRLVEYLMKRLESPSADVKAKVLNIIKHVCRKGNPSFRRAWQRESPAIKAHLQYHTAPDPLRGDEPSRRVRDNAKEALAAVFDASQDERKVDPVLAGRIQGFGVTPPPPPQPGGGRGHGAADNGGGRDMSGVLRSSMPSFPSIAYPSSSSSGGGGGVSNQPRFNTGSRYEGIGNPNFQDPRNQPKTLLERVSDAVREKVDKRAEASSQLPGVGGVKPPWMTQQGGGAVDMPVGYSYASNRGQNSYTTSAGSYDPTAAQRSAQQQTSAATAWVDPRSPRVALQGAPTQQQQQPASNGGGGGHSSRARQQAEPSDGTYERNFIEELCAPGGVRPVPPKDKLDAFCKACRTLDHNWVITLLDDKLAVDDWKVQHKALCVLEAVLQTPGLDAFADRLDASPDNLETLYNSKNPSVKERAQKVWKQLYDDDEAGAAAQNGSLIEDYDEQPGAASITVASTSSKTTAASSPPQGDLLDFTGGGASLDFSSMSSGGAAAPQTFSQPYPASRPDAEDGGLPNMFGNLSVKAAQPPVLSTSGPSVGFSFLSSGSPPAATARPAQTSSSNLFDLPVSQPVVGAASSGIDLFSVPVSMPGSSNFGLGGSGGDSMFAGLSGVSPQVSKPTKAIPQQQQAQAQKKADSFNFVQEALQSTRKT